MIHALDDILQASYGSLAKFARPFTTAIGDHPLRKSAAAFFIVSCLLPTKAVAASTGPITEIAMDPNNGSVTFIVNGPRTDLPACANAQGFRWSIDGSRPSAQATIALILSAKAQGKSVYVRGLGTCSAVQPNVESVSFVSSFD